MKKERGITLIALIITIIIMLILVGVSINVLIQSNIIGAAKKAGQDYKTESEKEAKLGDDVTIEGKSINEYVKNATGVYYHDEPNDHEVNKSLYFKIDDETHTLYISGHPKDEYNVRTLSTDSNAMKNGWYGDTSITKAIIEEDIYPSSCVRLFDGNTALEEIQDIKKLHTGNATSMRTMFQSCRSLTAIDTSNWDTSNVTNENWGQAPFPIL